MGNPNHCRDILVDVNDANEVIVEVSSRDKIQYQCALNLARYGQHRVRVGCTATVNGKRVAGAFNTIRNDHNNTDYLSATYHAEINTLVQVPHRLMGRVTLYIARLDVLNRRKPSYPCRLCYEFCSEKGIKAIVYMNQDNQLVKERVRNNGRYL